MSYYPNSSLILPMPPQVNLDNITATFDVDDVLWPQFATSAHTVGVDMLKMHTFSVRDNRYYSAEEKSKLFESFRSSRLFQDIQFYPGIEKIATLHKIGVHIKINSKSFTQQICELKRAQLKAVMPFLEDCDFNLTISNEDHATTGKQVDSGIVFFVDDNPHNIVTSAAYYNLLPIKPWNKNPEEQYRMRNKTFYIFDGLESIVETIIRSVHF